MTLGKMSIGEMGWAQQRSVRTFVVHLKTLPAIWKNTSYEDAI